MLEFTQIFFNLIYNWANKPDTKTRTEPDPIKMNPNQTQHKY